MEKKQGFFSALKEKVTSVLSPGGSRWSSSGDGYTGTKLSPIMEGPCPVFSKTDNISATEKMLYVMGCSLAPVRAAEPLRHLRVRFLCFLGSITLIIELSENLCVISMDFVTRYYCSNDTIHKLFLFFY